MNTETITSGAEAQERADFEAVLRHALDGTALDAEIARRVQERAAQVTAEIRRLQGEIDEDTLNHLLRDVRDES